MRSNAGFVRLLVEWLETEGPQDVPERVVAAALADARRVGQSHPLIRMPAWPAVARRPRLAFVLLAAALAVALALGALLSVGNRRGP
ncbi:MAG TPA: hypothetical protein VGK63_06000, partial [Candidatus Limnocylindrales bacterium]